MESIQKRMSARGALGAVWLAAVAAGMAGCGGGGSDAAAPAVTAAAAAAATGAATAVTAATAPVVAVTTAATATATTAAAGTTTAATTAGTTVAAPTTAATPATVSAFPALSAAAAAVLSLDLANLFNYAAPTLPAYYDAQVAATDNTPANNRIRNAGATLGRVLFYDKKLSFNNTIACASCHQQALGFSDSARFSAGFAGGSTTAHAMRLGNVRYWQPGNMFWDRRAASVEAQATQPIQNLVEMGFDASHGGIAALLAKMQTLPYYPELFTFAFGDSAITEARIQQALAQFERAMVSTNSRWDQGFAQTFNPALPDNGLDIAVPTLTAQENRGRHLFVAGPQQGGLACAACHVPPTFALAANSRSNGLDAGETIIFKSPSLKSAGLSGAFMHDGRFSTLEQVVEHYNSGVQNGPALDNRLRAGNNNGPRVLNLPADDKAALVAFLRSLNDTSLASDAKFSSPFKP